MKAKFPIIPYRKQNPNTLDTTIKTSDGTFSKTIDSFLLIRASPVFLEQINDQRVKNNKTRFSIIIESKISKGSLEHFLDLITGSNVQIPEEEIDDIWKLINDYQVLWLEYIIKYYSPELIRQTNNKEILNIKDRPITVSQYISKKNQTQQPINLQDIQFYFKFYYYIFNLFTQNMPQFTQQTTPVETSTPEEESVTEYLNNNFTTLKSKKLLPEQIEEIANIFNEKFNNKNYPQSLECFEFISKSNQVLDLLKKIKLNDKIAYKDSSIQFFYDYISNEPSPKPEKTSCVCKILQKLNKDNEPTFLKATFDYKLNIYHKLAREPNKYSWIEYIHTNYHDISETLFDGVENQTGDTHLQSALRVTENIDNIKEILKSLVSFDHKFNFMDNILSFIVENCNPGQKQMETYFKTVYDYCWNTPGTKLITNPEMTVFKCIETCFKLLGNPSAKEYSKPVLRFVLETVHRQSNDVFVKTMLYDFVIKNSLNAKIINTIIDNNEKTLLMHAVTHESNILVQYFLSKKSDVNLQDKEGKTALMYALQNKSSQNQQIIILLLTKPNIKFNLQIKDIYEKTALDYAFDNGVENNTIWTLFKQQVPQLTQEYEKAHIKQPEFKELPKKLDTTPITPQMKKYLNCDLATMKIDDIPTIIQNADFDPNLLYPGNKTPLMFLSIRGMDKYVHILLNRGADPSLVDANGYTAGFYAVQNGKPKVLAIILKFWKPSPSDFRAMINEASLKKADSLIVLYDTIKELYPNNVKDFFSTPGQNENTPLHLAAQKGIVDHFKVLIDIVKVNINCINKNGQTPLHLAVLGNRKEAVAALLKYKGIEPNIQDKQSKTPLFVAAESGFSEIITELLNSKNVDPNLGIKTYQGNQMPILKAIFSARFKAVEAFLSSGRIDTSIKYQSKDILKHAYLLHNSNSNKDRKKIYEYILNYYQSHNLKIDI